MRCTVLLSTACCILAVQAQELVPNGGFEEHTDCPALFTEIYFATGWSTPTFGSSDYFNGCQVDPYATGVPHNLMGYQPAHGGTAYAGIICFADPAATVEQDAHEYVSHALAAPLAPGQTYTVEFYVNLAALSLYAVNDIGALLSVHPPHRDDFQTIAAVPQITNTSLVMLDDTSGWARIQGCFTADSAYAFITIGNFRTGPNTTIQQVTPEGTGTSGSYYYVDDVSVQPVPRPDLGPDLTFCDAVTIAVQNPEPGTSYHWSTGESGPSITVHSAGNYSVTSDDVECPLSDTVVVQAGTPVTFSLSADTLVDFCTTPSIVLDAHPQPPDAQLHWSSGETTAAIVIDAAGTWVLQASGADRCAASASITIIDACETPVYAPNAFTPNGDGINDLWRPIWSANPDATIQWTIFDRWGEALFEPSAQQQAWDGTSDGTPMPNGCYVWKGHAQDPATGASRELRGHVVLVR